MSSRPKTSVREVLEAIGAQPGRTLGEQDASALLDLHLSLVQACGHTDDLDKLIKVRDDAQKALKATFDVRKDSQLARSHADQLVNALAPLGRLIEQLQKAQASSGKPRAKVDDKPQAKPQPPVGEPIPEHLPPAQKAVRQAVNDGGLAAKLNEPAFARETQTWMEQADPSDPEQRKDMLAVLKAMDPGKRAERQKAFELTFKTKIARSEERNYVPIISKLTQKPVIDRGTGKPMVTEELRDVPLDPVALSTMAEVMAQLPTAHMPKAWSIEGHDQDKGSNGSYNDDTDEAILRFSLLDVKDGFDQVYTNAGPGDPLEGAKAFDVLIRHECGHKAAAVAGSDELTNQAIGGAWVHHDTAEAVLDAIGGEFTDFVGKVQDSAGQPTAAAIRKAVADKDNGFVGPVIADVLGIDEARVPDDHTVLRLLRQGYNQRFNCGPDPVAVDGRIYVVGGPGAGSWHSFAKASWDKRVSYYQFAAPNEWFAEFYATANNGDPKVRQAAKNRYPEAWSWLNAKGCIVLPA